MFIIMKQRHLLRKLRRPISILSTRLRVKIEKVSLLQNKRNKRIHKLKRQKRPFIANINKTHIMDVKSLSELIPDHLINNLDIVASVSQNVEGDQAQKNMITMSYDEYISYDGSLNLYLAQVPLYKKIGVDDIDMKNKQQCLRLLNEEQYARLKINIPEEIVEFSQLESVNLWSNKGYTDSGWHYDSYDNFLYMVKGQKIVWLAKDTKDWSGWNPTWKDSYNHINSGIKQQRVASKFVRLQSEEALFIPRGWLHRVISISDSQAINIWFGDPKAQQISIGSHQLRYQLNELLQIQVSKSISSLIKETKINRQRNHSFYKQVASQGKFYQLKLKQKFRTQKDDDYLTEIHQVLCSLFLLPSNLTVQFINFLAEKFGKNMNLIVKKFSELHILILGYKLDEYSNKNKIVLDDLDRRDLYDQYCEKQKNHVQMREEFLSVLWKSVDADFLDKVEETFEKFKCEQMKSMIKMHI